MDTSDPIGVKMPDEVAAAIVHLVENNREEWSVLEHFIAVRIIKGRDLIEVTESKLGKYIQGLRYIFELYPRACSVLDKVPFQRSKLPGKGIPSDEESEYVIDPERGVNPEDFIEE